MPNRALAVFSAFSPRLHYFTSRALGRQKVSAWSRRPLLLQKIAAEFVESPEILPISKSSGKIFFTIREAKVQITREPEEKILFALRGLDSDLKALRNFFDRYQNPDKTFRLEGDLKFFLVARPKLRAKMLKEIFPDYT